MKLLNKTFTLFAICFFAPAEGFAVSTKNVTIEGMVFVPAGSTIIGSDQGRRDEAPSFEAEVSAFFLDVSPVAISDFKNFVNKTKYKSAAEKTGSSSVFDINEAKWDIKPGAHWLKPLGKEQDEALDDHPVTHVSWQDAKNYCEYKGKRLPSEIEWEYAANNATNPNSIYAIGKRLLDGERYKANVWQGSFPQINSKKDGFLYTSPIGYYAKTKLGLNDMAGNVWEWTSSDYRLYDQGYTEANNELSQKVLKGGSFMCDPTFCHGFRVSAREPADPDTPAFHIGFRCAADEV